MTEKNTPEPCACPSPDSCECWHLRYATDANGFRDMQDDDCRCFCECHYRDGEDLE